RRSRSGRSPAEGKRNHVASTSRFVALPGTDPRGLRIDPRRLPRHPPVRQRRALPTARATDPLQGGVRQSDTLLQGPGCLLPGEPMTADALVTASAGNSQAVEEMRTAADEVVLVGEDGLRSAVRLLHRDLELVVEPAGAAALAAVDQL